MLLPQTHSPEVDYSLFMMEMVEMSMQKMETTPAAPHRSFPPPICSSRSIFRCFCVSAALVPENDGGLFLQSFLCQDDVGGEKIDDNGASRAKLVGPTRLGKEAHGPPSFGPRGSTCSLPSPPSLVLSKNDARKFAGDLDDVWVPET